MDPVGLLVNDLLEEETLIHCAAAALLVSRRLKRRKERRELERRKRRFWVRPWLLRRPQQGQHEKLMAELAAEDKDIFKNYLRFDSEIFQELLARVRPRIEKKDTNWRKALDPALRLAITLRFLATGDSYKSLHYNFRVSVAAISSFIPETCEAIVEALAPEFLTLPRNEAEWKSVSEGFSKRWNFHNTLGALDGKHIRIKCPKNGGSVYYNYKGFHSIVLMALVDAEYRFLYVDVGSNGSWSDAGIFSDCELRTAMEDGTASIPPDAPLPNDDVPMPFTIIADDAFPLRSWLMKPYPHQKMNNSERIFNCRFSRGRRVVENAFGILAHRFRCLLGTVQLIPANVKSVVLECCVLHNLLRTRFPVITSKLVDREDSISHDIIEGTSRGDAALPCLQALRGNNATKAAKAQRDYLRMYYNSEVGSVP